LVYAKSPDFFVWTSFPSSLKLENDTPEDLYHDLPQFTVKAGDKLLFKANFKGEGVELCGLNWAGWNGREWRWLDAFYTPTATFDWVPLSKEYVVPADITIIAPHIGMKKGKVWMDDFEAYVNDVLTVREGFSNWNPYIGAGLGGVGGVIAGYLINPKEPLVPALVGAGLGAGLGGGAGYFVTVPASSSPTQQGQPQTSKRYVVRP